MCVHTHNVCVCVCLCVFVVILKLKPVAYILNFGLLVKLRLVAFNKVEPYGSPGSTMHPAT